jgi:PAS domain S-box-containing protein
MVLMGRNVAKKKLLECCDRCKEPIMITELSVDHPTILYTNKEHVKLTGYYNAELVGKRPTIFQGKNTCIKTINELKNALEEKDFWMGQLINYHKDGTEQYIHMTIFTISIERNHYYVVHKKLIG